MDVSTLPCPICGQTNYEFGTLEHYKHEFLATHTKSTFFRKDGIRRQAFGIFNNLMSEKPVEANRGRRCLTCNNVQIFMNLDSSK